MIRVADYIAKYIYNLGVKDVFLLSGGGMMFLSDGIIKNKDLHFWCNHHEQASAMAAVAYAKFTNNLGVAYFTTGCGSTNAITGVLNAWQDNIPCLFISGQVKKSVTIRNSGLKLRQFGVQEADIVSIIESITKYSVMVNEPEKIVYHLDKAIFLAKSGRPGPVWLDIPMDVQSAIVDENTLERFIKPSLVDMEYKEDVTKDEYANLYQLIKAAKRPVVIAGQGIRLSGANEAFLKFIEKYHLPVVATYLGTGIIPTKHNLFIGRIGSKGERAGNFAVQNSDLVISLGSRLDISALGHQYDYFAREAKKVVIDIDPIEHQKKTIKIDLFINADVLRFLSGFNNGEFTSCIGWIEKCQKWKKQWPVLDLKAIKLDSPVSMYYFVDSLSRLMPDNAVVISDAGSSFYVASQAIQLKKNQRYITSGGQAEMGYTVPACIGVSIAREKGEVIGITGDGSFQLNIQELQTIVHNNLPIKLFVWNNDGYLSIRATQRKFFDERYIGTDGQSGVSFPELKKISEAYGVQYVKIENNSEVDSGINKVLLINGPVICEVICERDQEVIPAVSSFRRADGSLMSKPMEDMYPFLSRDEFLENMVIGPIDEQ